MKTSILLKLFNLLNISKLFLCLWQQPKMSKTKTHLHLSRRQSTASDRIFFGFFNILLKVVLLSQNITVYCICFIHLTWMNELAKMWSKYHIGRNGKNNPKNWKILISVCGKQVLPQTRPWPSSCFLHQRSSWLAPGQVWPALTWCQPWLSASSLPPHPAQKHKGSLRN